VPQLRRRWQVHDCIVNIWACQRRCRQGRKHELARQQEHVIVPRRRSLFPAAWCYADHLRKWSRTVGGPKPPTPASVVDRQVVQLTIVQLLATLTRTQTSSCTAAASLPTHLHAVKILSCHAGVLVGRSRSHPPFPPARPAPRSSASATCAAASGNIASSAAKRACIVTHSTRLHGPAGVAKH